MWACGPHPVDPSARWPLPILSAVVTAFSTPGDRVLLTTLTGDRRKAPSDDDLTAALNTVRDLDRAAAHTRLDQSPPQPDGREPVDLLVASHTPSDHEPVDLLAQHAARLVRTGGILAVLTHTDSAHGELRDPTGDIVAAAQNADLLYLQHIVCLLAPIRDGDLTPLPTDPAAVGESSPAWFRHRRVHTDLLVFAQPHNHHTPAATGGDAR